MQVKMKAVVVNKENDLKLQEVDVPEISKNEVLIKSRAVGICHSDYEVIGGRYIIPFGYPIILGHEWAGDIVEVGEDVDVNMFKVGDRVTGECVIGCGNCDLCKSGNFTNCPNAQHFGLSMDGADAEFFKAKPEWLHKLPGGVSYEAGALIEPFSCGFYAVEVNGGTNANETVVIAGGGAIGLCALATVKGMGARAIVIEPMRHRMEVAKRLGADFVINPSEEDPVEKVLEYTEKKGADFVIEASGNDESLKTILDLPRNNGRVSMVGINIGKKHPIEFGKIQAKGLVLKGCVGSPWVWDKAIKFLNYTQIDLTVIQTHRFSLDEAETAFDLASQRDKCIKVVLLNE